MYLMMTGEASARAGCDRRTFLMEAQRLRIKPFATTNGSKVLFLPDDVEKITKSIQEKKKAKMDRDI